MSYLEPVPGGWVAIMLDCYAGGLPFESDILSMLKYACKEQQLVTILVVKRLVGVTPEANLREHIYPSSKCEQG